MQSIVNAYVEQIKANVKTINDVPERIREDVKKVLLDDGTTI